MPVEGRLPRLVVGVDPGGTTGIAYSSRGSVVCHQIAPCDEDEKLVAVTKTLSNICTLAEPLVGKDLVHIVVERFEHRPEERDRVKIVMVAGEVVGAIRAWAYQRPHVKLVLSGASLGKGFWSDDKIKALGLWVPGNKHAMDALRHQLRYRLFTLNEQSLLEPLRPIDVPARTTTAAMESIAGYMTQRIK